ncbi:hypothetical protein [Nocardia sp. NPDC051833]|uniref:hypothetical protein n=1 Tax=Nocardia sp. NPDC051833 TaxID=3155674 RepID=UPI0034317B82
MLELGDLGRVYVDDCCRYLVVEETLLCAFTEFGAGGEHHLSTDGYRQQVRLAFEQPTMVTSIHPRTAIRVVTLRRER